MTDKEIKKAKNQERQYRQHAAHDKSFDGFKRDWNSGTIREPFSHDLDRMPPEEKQAARDRAEARHEKYEKYKDVKREWLLKITVE